MQTTKSQHLVPQAYLKNFEAEKRTLWVFDKALPVDSSKNLNRRSIKSVACKPYFYDLPATLRAEDSENFQIAEKTLAVVEGIGMRFVNATNSGARKILGTGFDPRAFITPSERYFMNMADYLVIQHLRTEDARSFVRWSMELYGEIELRKKFDDIGEKLDDGMLSLKANDNWVKWHQLESMMNFERYAPYFKNRIWRLGINSTNLGLWTSDTPVVIHKMRSDVGRAGIGEFGTVICFPTASFSALLLFDPTMFAGMRSLHGKPMHLSVEFGKTLNRLQLQQCTRTIFSSNQFSADDKKLFCQFAELKMGN